MPSAGACDGRAHERDRLAGSISCGRTRVSEHDERVFEVELSCPDDALAIGALSSATFMMDWAYLHADQPAPTWKARSRACATWCWACAPRPRARILTRPSPLRTAKMLSRTRR
ncbi:MAG: hypothetical protein ACLU37_09520 [Collinsella sp.]